VLYVGKLGSLRPEHVPNKWLATGCGSDLRGELVTWKIPLEYLVQNVPSVAHGVHCTLPSVLYETWGWLDEKKDMFAWVDPEIGYMAKASVAGETMFGYLHIISDNPARKYNYDLSNERLIGVIRDRKKIVEDIQAILEK